MSNAPLILFICSGNYYRSRFAEEVFNVLAREKCLPWRADSVGLKVTESRHQNPGPISAYALNALRRHGIDPLAADREPRQVTLADLDRATLRIALCRREHEPMVNARIPHARDRIEYWDIEDLGLEEAQSATTRIHAQVLALIETLAEEA